MPTGPSADRSMSSEYGIGNRLIGSALLTNTTACEASRLLLPSSIEVFANGKYWTRYMPSALRVCDLMSLIDAVVLHEQIFYLPASLPDDARELELRNRLVESGILAPLPMGDDPNLVGEALLASLSSVSGPCGPPERPEEGIETSFEEVRPRLMNELKLSEAADHTISDHLSLPFRVYTYEGFLASPKAESFDQAVRSLIYYMEYAELMHRIAGERPDPQLLGSHSGRYQDATASLRAMYYVFASEHYSLPYLASASVQAVQRKFPNYFQPSVRERLYVQLASALQATVDTVTQQFGGALVFVPPFSALVLNRAARPEEISSEMLALRAEYSDFRRKMRELERDHLEARSLNDQLKALRKIEQLGKEVARPFDQPSRMKLEPALRYIPDAAQLAANPTNPAGWTRVLLGLPIEELISWYRRRPVAKLVRTARAVGALPDYDRLLAKHFGGGLASRVLEIQGLLQNT